MCVHLLDLLLGDETIARCTVTSQNAGFQNLGFGFEVCSRFTISKLYKASGTSRAAILADIRDNIGKK